MDWKALDNNDYEAQKLLKEYQSTGFNNSSDSDDDNPLSHLPPPELDLMEGVEESEKKRIFEKTKPAEESEDNEPTWGGVSSKKKVTESGSNWAGVSSSKPKIRKKESVRHVPMFSVPLVEIDKRIKYFEKLERTATDRKKKEAAWHRKKALIEIRNLI